MKTIIFIPLLLLLITANEQNEPCAYNFIQKDGVLKAVKKINGEMVYNHYDSFEIILNQQNEQISIDKNDLEVKLACGPFKIISVLEDNQIIYLNISENDNVYSNALIEDNLLNNLINYAGYFGFAEWPLNPDTSLYISDNNPPFLWNVWAMDGKNINELKFDEIKRLDNKYQCVRTVNKINDSFKKEIPMVEYINKTLYFVVADVRVVYDETKKYEDLGDWVRSTDFYIIKTLRFKIAFN